MRIRLPVLLALVAAAASAPSYADSSSCARTQVAPHGGTLPANAPALVVGAHRASGGDVVEFAPNDFELQHNGEAVELELRDRDDGFFEAYLIEDLEPGETYEILTGSEACDEACYTFTAGPRAPLPTSAGTLAIVDATPVDGSVEPLSSETLVTLRFTPSLDLDPFLSIARLSLEPAISPAGETVRSWVAPREFTVRVTCGAVWQLAREVRVAVELPGVDRVLRSPSVPLQVVCSKAWKPPNSEPAPSPEFVEAKVCASAPPVVPLPRDDVTAFTGCALGGGSSGWMGVAIVSALALLGLARRRRRVVR